MERINISLTQKQLVSLRAYSKETGIGISELLRRLIDQFFSEQAESENDAKEKDTR
jgi:metal-responsive CopG/Arc/MetJ family transcriptional regulator